MNPVPTNPSHFYTNYFKITPPSTPSKSRDISTVCSRSFHTEMKHWNTTIKSKKKKKNFFSFLNFFSPPIPHIWIRNPASRSGPPLWSSDQGSWLQIQRSGFDSRRYQILWEVVGLEQGPLSLASTIEELLERKSRGSCLENWEYGLGIHRANHVAPSIRKSWH
jgi:hypothetical protein